MNHYHNTTNTPDPREYEAKALSQDDLVLEYFKRMPGGHTPSEVASKVLVNAPMTSARRAMSNLTEAGHLFKTSRQQIGPYGRPEYVWVLDTGQPRLL